MKNEEKAIKDGLVEDKKVTMVLDDSVQPDKNPRRRFSIQFDFDYGGDPGKVVEGESETVPEMNLTIRQLLQNHTRIDDKVQVKQPLYFETTIPTIRDITDVEHFRDELKRKYDETVAFLAHEQEEKEKAEKQKATDGQQLSITDPVV